MLREKKSGKELKISAIIEIDLQKRKQKEKKKKPKHFNYIRLAYHNVTFHSIMILYRNL